jgi:hypothetical protein
MIASILPVEESKNLAIIPLIALGNIDYLNVCDKTGQPRGDCPYRYVSNIFLKDIRVERLPKGVVVPVYPMGVNRFIVEFTSLLFGYIS